MNNDEAQYIDHLILILSFYTLHCLVSWLWIDFCSTINMFSSSVYSQFSNISHFASCEHGSEAGSLFTNSLYMSSSCSWYWYTLIELCFASVSVEFKTCYSLLFIVCSYTDNLVYICHKCSFVVPFELVIKIFLHWPANRSLPTSSPLAALPRLFATYFFYKISKLHFNRHTSAH